MCALICFILSSIKQLIIFFKLSANISKKKRGSYTASKRGTGIPK
ncbi:hypothetical protein HMPREF9441_02411 [Paraprevotella clara YIT 11840]|uniref:Uncharacterized protein n=1 Tax=Paraprevotella clara YIT 11840 TaxID=762968 RepID=G5SSR2_9BACT|nr:hypothetical protein HMPREF9441_02411 [Paraprevotella clara YIT 11840]